MLQGVLLAVAGEAAPAAVGQRVPAVLVAAVVVLVEWQLG